MGEKVGIISPHFHTLRGAEFTAVVLCEALNEKGIVPDLYAFKDPKGLVHSRFGKTLRYSFKRILSVPKPALRLRAYSTIFTHLLLKDIKGYDFVYDMHGYDVAYGTKNNGKYLLYVHFPYFLEQSRLEYQKGGLLKKAYCIPIFLFNRYAISKYHPRNISIVANSTYTKEKILQHLPGEDVRVVYPPVPLSGFSRKQERKEEAVTLGAFDSNKNQLLQVELASRNPDVMFHICGEASDKAYFSKVQAKAKKAGNVRLHPNISFAKLKVILERAKYFVHTMKGEHFGISIVQGIAAGCVPLVHYSGGQKEILSEPGFFWRTEKDIFSSFSHLRNKTVDRRKLLGSMQAFDEGVFKKKMRSYLNEDIVRPDTP